VPEIRLHQRYGGSTLSISTRRAPGTAGFVIQLASFYWQTLSLAAAQPNNRSMGTA
jgi:hypothetical protein